MNSKNKIFTMFVSLSCVLGMTLITHYVVTGLPDPIINSNIDTGAVAVDVNAFDATGATPLIEAATYSDVGSTKILLEKGADPNIPSANSDRDYPINYALINGNQPGSREIALMLMDHGADVRVANARGLAPVHAIMQITDIENRKAMLDALMEHGADINAQAEDGSTMLHITATITDWNWVKYVNEKYGQIVNYAITDKLGRTPLDLTELLGHVSLNDADSVQYWMQKRPTYIGDDFNVRATDNQGRDGLQLAVIRTDMKYTQALIQHKADLAHQDNKGNTALHYAVVNLDPLKYVDYLLREKAPVNIANEKGETPLFWVMRIRSPATRLAVAQLLLDAGSPITNKNKIGQTLADLAGKVHDTQLVDLIQKTLQARRTP